MGKPEGRDLALRQIGIDGIRSGKVIALGIDQRQPRLRREAQRVIAGEGVERQVDNLAQIGFGFLRSVEQQLRYAQIGSRQDEQLALLRRLGGAPLQHRRQDFRSACEIATLKPHVGDIGSGLQHRDVVGSQRLGQRIQACLIDSFGLGVTPLLHQHQRKIDGRALPDRVLAPIAFERQRLGLEQQRFGFGILPAIDLDQRQIVAVGQRLGMIAPQLRKLMGIDLLGQRFGLGIAPHVGEEQGVIGSDIDRIAIVHAAQLADIGQQGRADRLCLAVPSGGQQQRDQGARNDMGKAVGRRIVPFHHLGRAFHDGDAFAELTRVEIHRGQRSRQGKAEFAGFTRIGQRCLIGGFEIGLGLCEARQRDPDIAQRDIGEKGRRAILSRGFARTR